MSALLNLLGADAKAPSSPTCRERETLFLAPGGKDDATESSFSTQRSSREEWFNMFLLYQMVSSTFSALSTRSISSLPKGSIALIWDGEVAENLLDPSFSSIRAGVT